MMPMQYPAPGGGFGERSIPFSSGAYSSAYGSATCIKMDSVPSVSDADHIDDSDADDAPEVTESSSQLL